VLQQRLEQLGPAQRVGQRQVALDGIHRVHKLGRPLTVDVVLSDRPVDLLEELGPAARGLDEELLLDGVAELALAGRTPQGVDLWGGFEGSGSRWGALACVRACVRVRADICLI
jgi:hypothetical protein